MEAEAFYHSEKVVLRINSDPYSIYPVFFPSSATMVSYISLARLKESSNHLPRLVGRSIGLDNQKKQDGDTP